jgi:hypothetical protein
MSKQPTFAQVAHFSGSTRVAQTCSELHPIMGMIFCSSGS